VRTTVLFHVVTDHDEFISRPEVYFIQWVLHAFLKVTSNFKHYHGASRDLNLSMKYFIR
jgi:hypothetical protein